MPRVVKWLRKQAGGYTHRIHAHNELPVVWAVGNICHLIEQSATSVAAPLQCVEGWGKKAGGGHVLKNFLLCILYYYIGCPAALLLLLPTSGIFTSLWISWMMLIQPDITCSSLMHVDVILKDSSLILFNDNLCTLFMCWDVVYSICVFIEMYLIVWNFITSFHIGCRLELHT